MAALTGTPIVIFGVLVLTAADGFQARGASSSIVAATVAFLSILAAFAVALFALLGLCGELVRLRGLRQAQLTANRSGSPRGSATQQPRVADRRE